MKTFLSLLTPLLMITLSSSAVHGQTLISQEYVQTLNLNQVQDLLGVPGTYAVDVYRIQHTLTDDLGQMDTIGGLITMPTEADDAMALVIYGHGTSNDQNDAPSNLRTGYFEAVAYATSGFVCGATDYIGLGVSSDRFHPYVHGESEALASIAMAEMAFDFMESMGITSDRSMFLSGYSQGGHTSMATQKYIVDNGLDITVLGAAHGSGPYSISDVMREEVVTTAAYPAGLAYVPYLIAGYQSAYGDVYTDLEDIFLPDFTGNVADLISYDVNLSSTGLAIGSTLFFSGQALTPRNILQPEVVTAMETADPNDPLLQYLRANDTYGFVPQAPTRMYYCEADEQVPFENALLADSVMNAQGAADVEAVSLDPNADHGDCARLAIPESIDFFTRLLMSSSSEEVARASEITAYPNPVQDVLYVAQVPAEAYGQIIDAQGRQVLTTHTLQNGINVSGLASGLYTLELHIEGSIVVKRFLKL